jgi:hypothetical protein
MMCPLWLKMRCLECIVTYSGFYSWRNFIALQKVNTIQLNTVRNSSNTHTRPTRTVPDTHSYRILPTGPLVAIFQHSLPFLQSESFQTHVRTIHRRVIGPLAHHNGTPAYSPSLTCHLPAPTHKHICPWTILKPHCLVHAKSLLIDDITISIVTSPFTLLCWNVCFHCYPQVLLRS